MHKEKKPTDTRAHFLPEKNPHAEDKKIKYHTRGALSRQKQSIYIIARAFTDFRNMPARREKKNEHTHTQNCQPYHKAFSPPPSRRHIRVYICQVHLSPGQRWRKNIRISFLRTRCQFRRLAVKLSRPRRWRWWWEMGLFSLPLTPDAPVCCLRVYMLLFIFALRLIYIYIALVRYFPRGRDMFDGAPNVAAWLSNYRLRTHGLSRGVGLAIDYYLGRGILTILRGPGFVLFSPRRLEAAAACLVLAWGPPLSRLKYRCAQFRPKCFSCFDEKLRGKKLRVLCANYFSGSYVYSCANKFPREYRPGDISILKYLGVKSVLFYKFVRSSSIVCWRNSLLMLDEWFLWSCLQYFVCTPNELRIYWGIINFPSSVTIKSTIIQIRFLSITKNLDTHSATRIPRIQVHKRIK